ncbi:retrovirus-related pol polyprotein from transposon TNT 1-94 [Tanacetum coccineum]
MAVQIKEGIEGVQKPRYKQGWWLVYVHTKGSIDYNEVFSLVVRHTSIRVILALTACKDYELEQLDVKTHFTWKSEETYADCLYLANPGKNHWEAVKWILKYLRGTVNVGLVYGTHRGNHVDVTGFVDSDYAKDPDKERSGTKPVKVCKVGTEHNVVDALQGGSLDEGYNTAWSGLKVGV